MGCCTSTQSTYTPSAPQSSSTRAINTQPQPSFSPSAQPRPSSASSGPGLRTPHRRLDTHITKPLKLHVWKIKSGRGTPWTRRAIDKERAEYFDTRVTGRPEIWLTLRSVCGELWIASRSGSTDQERKERVATAQSMMLAADITIPTGDLADGAYDALGNMYELKAWLVADPTNLAPDDVAEDDGSMKDKDAATVCDSMDEDEVLKRREEKGKAVLADEDAIRVKARFSEGGKDVVVHVDQTSSVRFIAKALLEASTLSKRRLKLVYMGKMLKEGESLGAQGWQEGHVINALVFSQDD